MFKRKKQLKFHNHTFQAEGVDWDSKLEYHRWLYLSSLYRSGYISDLRRQVPFEIIPRQLTTIDVQLKTKVRHDTRVIEQNAVYTADFVYFAVINGQERMVIEDVKSEVTRREQDYVLRRKLMRLQGNPIVEVTSPAQAITYPEPSYTEG